MSCNCSKPKCDGKCGISPAVLQINNPGDCTLFHRVEVPASMGDSTANPPKNGDYRNVLLYYVADGTSWLFSSDGIPQKLVNGFTDYEDAINLPQINGITLLGDKSSADLKLADAPMVITIASGNTTWSGANTAEDIYNFFLSQGKVNVVFEGSENYGYEIVSAAYIPGEQKMMCMVTAASVDPGSTPVEFSGNALYGLMTFYTAGKAVDVGELDLQPKLFIADFTGLELNDNVLSGVPATNANIGMVKPGDGLEVASDGTLSISDIEQYAYFFNTVADMQGATNLINGDRAVTFGFYSKNDGGGAMYFIRQPQLGETSNGITTFDITGGLVAEIVKHPIMSAKQFGCKANGVDDDTTTLQGVIDYCGTKKVVLHMDSGTYMVSQVVISNNLKMTGDGTNSVIRGINNNTAESVLKIYNDGLLNTEVSNIQIDGNLYNTSSVVDGLELEEDRVDGGGDKYTYVHDIKVKNCTGHGIHVDGTDSSAVREIRMENLNIGDCQKNGLYINNTTDSMFDKITSHGNIQYGIEVGGGSHKFSNCKCFWNGKGDETTRDASRAPADAFTATSDVSPQPGKIYYTRSGNGVQNDWYVFTEFTGDSFDGGTTYYEMTTIYTKRYAGFRLNTNSCVYVNLEAQDNYGDGIELGGSGNQLSSIKLDNNGLLCDENNVPISYATAGKTQCYYGVYGRGYRTNINSAIFVNHRSDSIGKSQAGAVFLTQSTWFLLNGGGDNVDNNIPVFTQGLDWLARVKIQGHYNGYPIETEIRLADIIPRTGLSWVDGSAKVINGVCHIQGELKDTNGIVPDSNERVIFGLAGAYSPSKNTFTTAYVSNDHGYTLGGIVTLKIGSNSAVSVKAADNSLASYQNLLFDFQFPVAVNSW